MAITDRPTSDVEAERSCEPAMHIAATARALVAMGAMASEISTRQRVDAERAELIRRLLPALARRYDIEAVIEECGDVLTVAFTRRAPALPES